MLAGRREKTAAAWSTAAEQLTGQGREPQSPWKPGFSQPWRVWVESGDGSVLFKHHGGPPFYVWRALLKSSINAAGFPPLKSIDQHRIRSQSQISVLGAPEAEHWETVFSSKVPITRTLGHSPHFKKTAT